MANVWKVGSRWDDQGLQVNSILSIFRRNNVVFVGSSDEIRTRFYAEVKKGDFIAIADGYQIVAVAKAVGKPAPLKDIKQIDIEPSDFNLDVESTKEWVIGVKVKIVDIDEVDYEQFYYQKRGTFCSVKQEILRKRIVTYYDRQFDKFSIQAYTATLFQCAHCENYKSLLDTDTKYIIPVYQRPYEWGEDQIGPFITDIVNAYLGEEKTAKHSEPMFIGTMQLSQKKYINAHEYEQDVIDGQQRITTLLILLFELQKKYPSCDFLRDLHFDWLQTRINAEQKKYMQSYFKQGVESPLNKYYENSHLILETLESSFPQEFVFDIDSFCSYLSHFVYFVVIETTAGLSKTIQIFNTINNSGLDLDGGDLFKVRMYEYLTDFQSADDTIFEEINKLYQYIDEQNKGNGRVITTIGEILDIYKNVLITKYNLPIELYSFGWETFYNRIFDTLLGVKDWGSSFKAALRNGLQLSLNEITKVITIRYAKEQYKYQNIETEFATRHTDWSRYGRSKHLMMYVFLFFHWDEKDKFSMLEQLIIEMNKVFFTYSIVYYKQIWEINSFVANAVQSVKDNSAWKTISLFKQKLDNEDLQESVRKNLMGVINDNAKRKNLICALDTYLYERDIVPNYVIAHIFQTSFDVEHIHANADETIEFSDTLQNSIGNLTQLEQSLNRSIQDKVFAQKRLEYEKSCYLLVQDIAQLEHWCEKDAESRRNAEVNAMIAYIFNK